jgi:glycosyltransferase involved in cell wall biosynthesis
MGCGLPVVATQSGAVPELIEEDCTGKLVAEGPGEVEQLADAVIHVTRDPQAYQDFSRATTLAAKRFSTDLAVERTMQVYAEWL